MSEQIDSILQYVPENLHGDVRRLFNISPQFSQLMRSAGEEECRLLFRPLEEAVLPDAGETWVPPSQSSDLVACMSHLRRCKHRGHRHLIWWEMGLRGDMDISCRAIADLASGLMGEAVRMAERLIAPRYGHVEGGSFCVIGLGKLGGRELNLGSDVDPLFIWQGNGNTVGGRQSIPAPEYYMHLSRMLIRLMSERTADGIVWPVDMRLRPGGDGSAIVQHLEATLSHYLEYGQTWERAMLIKARPVAGDMQLGDAFIEGIAPFIFRRYLDYTTVAALAEMKRRIDGQAGSGGIAPGYDVKRGRGGIREIEFIIQSMQLLHAGRNKDLRIQPSMQAIDRLMDAGVIAEEDVSELKAAYRFWRRIEHAIQSRRGEQTHKLPDDYADYLSTATGIADIEQQMVHHAAIVESAFGKFVKPVGEEQKERDWLSGANEGLQGRSDEDRDRMLLALERVDAWLLRGLLPERSRAQVSRILDQAMPKWLDDENGVTALEAFADLIRSVSGRATWIDLLATHQGALDWLIGVLSASRYLADHIVKDPSWLEWPLMTEHSEADIRDICAGLDSLDQFDDIEQALADIGRWVDRARLLCALAVDAHTADAMTVGGWMADMADAATSAVIRLCLSQMDLPKDFPFVALAMGKHGSHEMGLVSDLDMVFVLVHDNPGEMCGKRSFGEHAQRIGRRAIQYLTAAPPFGAGFEFDARLRPSGSSGVLVTSLKGFHDYQLGEAQTWEHQALCRSRAAAGPQDAKAAVESVVAEVLNKPRDRKALAADVLEMRSKMVEHLSSRSDEIINLKQDEGGLVDIEFLAQYARLAFGGAARRTIDVLRDIPDCAPAAWREEGGWLADSYLDYRQMENALRVELWRSIGKLPNRAEATEWETMRRHAAITTPDALKDRMQRVRAAYNRLLVT
ncbi:glutamate-ammonia-ligase adenylyltransferase [Mariprofundus ferrinatatus]|uniref:Glutamate-ammonia-ligase adenylyltransferase n=1 Tax=Mariprofundus ferrinatatus TaxID=1921087 RepID=A0A2K8L514_9PROT|nr:bifunctional [glutamate--ammonia ligase]-adenylyl-L-tyrosine phosphorylase/[glutamate--ammonia-ligase] adenylyltransferase [Mariprofundus ferrinatatus]ATX82408.1 glutamate-ammonia-ligase adenylyltransferase [Mariprofundus ferrinatatus]